MKTKNLLQERYKVISDYPGCGFRIGTILNQEYGSSAFNKWVNELPISNISVYTPEKWPHIFKKLEWWEERELSDFPAYLKVIRNGCSSIGNGKIFKPISYGIYSNEGRNFGNEGHPFAVFLILEDSETYDKGEEITMHLKNCFPSTEEEYLSNLEKLQAVQSSR